MKFTISFLLIALLSFAACLFLPWWCIALVAFLVVAFISQRPLYAFLCGFFSVALLWALLSFYISSKNEHLLAHKVSLLILKMDNPLFLIVATAFIGGLVAGMGALTASFIRRPALAEARNI